MQHKQCVIEDPHSCSSFSGIASRASLPVSELWREDQNNTRPSEGCLTWPAPTVVNCPTNWDEADAAINLILLRSDKTLAMAASLDAYLTGNARGPWH